ncbi:MAG TPA: hypothetical protein PKN32_14205 [Bacteroidales bacterium]|nr:hypothetical protein [Bacteroidales bacterium]
MVPPPINFDYTNINFSISLPIPNDQINQLKVFTFQDEKYPQNQSVTLKLKKNCFNTISLFKGDKLFAIVRSDPSRIHDSVISPDMIGKSLLSLVFDFLTPGYNGVKFAIDNAVSSIHFQDLINLLNSKWNSNGISDLIDDSAFKTCLLSIISDLLPQQKGKIDLTKDRRIFSIPFKSNESISYFYITFPSIKLSGLDITEISINQNKAKFKIKNSRRRQTDVYLYKNDQIQSTFALGGRVQSGLIATALSELVCPSEHEFELDFTGMAFKDSYCMNVLGPAWSFPWVTDTRYSNPWIRTMAINQGLPVLTFLFDVSVKPEELEPIKQVIIDLYNWLQVEVDWIQIQNQFKNRSTEDNLFFVDFALASMNALYTVLTKTGVVENIGANIFHYCGTALTSWTTCVKAHLGDFFRLLQFFAMVVEELRVMDDYMNTAYRTDFYFVNGVVGQGDLQGTWQGLSSNPFDGWQSFSIMNHTTPYYIEEHSWGYYTKAGFCESMGYDDYNPGTRQGTGYTTEFIKNLPNPGWCFSITAVSTFQVNDALNHMDGTFSNAQPGDPCQAPGGTFYLDKIR